MLLTPNREAVSLVQKYNDLSSFIKVLLNRTFSSKFSSF